MDIVMPKMGESVSEGTIIKWHKNPGDPVKRDEIIFEISTDKVDTEIPSPADGILSEIKVKEGETVEVGTVVAVINSEGSIEQQLQPEVKETGSYQEDTREADTTRASLSEVVNTQETGRTGTSPGEGNVIDIAMPKMGESVMEGTIIKWHKKVGDAVKKDETIFEISTDKVDTEVPSPDAGVLSEILVAEQETVEVGTIVARLTTGSSPAAVKMAESKTVEVKPQQPKAAEEKEVHESMHDNFAAVSARSEEAPASKEVNRFYSPLVLSIAQKENISFDELGGIQGTGLEGRVTKKDIFRYLESRKTQKPAAAPAPAAEKKKETVSYIPSPGGSISPSEVEKIPMDNIRQKIMQHMVSSRDTSVHVSAMLEVDMSRIYNFIQAKKDDFLKKEGIKLTYMPFIANAVVKALKENPLVNSAIDGSTILKKKFINLGIAVAIEPAGLIVPNIKRADEKNLTGLAKSIADLASRARNKKLSPDDISNGTFTITNYGVFGTLVGFPIINQPEVAILGVGAVVKRPVVIEVEGMDTIAVKPIMALTLTHDHRLVDGMLGGRFLKFIKDSLENFDSNSY
jgi:pyruvate dehydrogenase E2 component (dihydrolipoamide acetyltransferase)